jgi:hypothetical protein
MSSHSEKTLAALKRRQEGMPGGAVMGKKGESKALTTGFKLPGSRNRKKGFSVRGH